MGDAWCRWGVVFGQVFGTPKVPNGTFFSNSAVTAVFSAQVCDF